MPRFKAAIAAFAVLFGMAAGTAHAEVSEIRISHGFGILYLPIMVMEHEHLLEKHAQAAGLGDVKPVYRVLDGGNVINDGMLSGALDVASLGAPGFLTLWSKTAGNDAQAVIGLAGLSSSSMYLMTRNPAVKSLKDFTEKDRIAVPGIKTSLPAVVLQMAAAKTFGDDGYNKLDPITVPLPHPEAAAVMLGGRGQIDSHMASPPFSYTEAKAPGLHRVFNSVDLLGHITLDMTYTTQRFQKANPKLCAAFVDALREADTMIARDKPKAAQIYLDSVKVKASKAEVLTILEDPDTRFDTAPTGMMDYAHFMHRVGTIKTVPTKWQALFAPPVRDGQGS